MIGLASFLNPGEILGRRVQCPPDDRMWPSSSEVGQPKPSAASSSSGRGNKQLSNSKKSLEKTKKKKKFLVRSPLSIIARH